MTPADVNTYARQRYNAINDTFFSDLELYTAMFQAEMELARESLCIKKKYTTTTVVGQQEYQKPASCFAVKRITYNGRKIFKINDREDDALTLNNQVTTAQGTPQYYWEWDTALELRPVPDDTQALVIYSYDMPQSPVSATSTIDVPLRYHAHLAEFLLWKMAEKDKNFDAAQIYATNWRAAVADAKKYEASLKRRDSFTHVLDEESLPVTIIGAF